MKNTNQKIKNIGNMNDFITYIRRESLDIGKNEKERATICLYLLDYSQTNGHVETLKLISRNRKENGCIIEKIKKETSLLG